MDTAITGLVLAHHRCPRLLDPGVQCLRSCQRRKSVWDRPHNGFHLSTSIPADARALAYASGMLSGGVAKTSW